MTAEEVDVVIVGGRCAGAPLATHLADAGLRVCVVDQARFPSDTASTHAIQPSGVAALGRLGVLPQIQAVSPPVERLTMVVDDVSVEFDGASKRLGAPLHNVRRVTLDQILLDRAAAAGADVRTRTTVTGLIDDGNRVTGVRTSNGDISARLVVGADGVRSTIASLVGAAEYQRTDPGRIFLWGYFENATAPPDLMWFGKRGDNGFLASHSDSGLFMTVAALSVLDRERVLADRQAAFDAALPSWPELAETLAPARRVGPLRTVAEWHGYFRVSAGPGWVLVGDAGHFKDPTPGQGIADALRQVEELAPAIVAALGQHSPDALDRRMREWWRWRDRDAWDMYWFARDLGAPGPTPVFLREVIRELRDAGDIDRLFEVLNHARPASKLAPTPVALRAAARGVRRPDGGFGVLGQMATVVREGGRHRRALRAALRNFA